MPIRTRGDTAWLLPFGRLKHGSSPGWILPFPEPEEIENPERELMRLEPGLRTKRDGHVRRLRKNRQEWLTLAERTRTELDHIQSVCPHCEQFLSYFETAIDQGP